MVAAHMPPLCTALAIAVGVAGIVFGDGSIAIRASRGQATHGALDDAGSFAVLLAARHASGGHGQRLMRDQRSDMRRDLFALRQHTAPRHGFVGAGQVHRQHVDLVVQRQVTNRGLKRLHDAGRAARSSGKMSRM